MRGIERFETAGRSGRLHRRVRGTRAACGGAEEGSVTAELAVALPAVMIVLLLVLGFGAASTSQIRVVDAARAGARVASLGDDDGAVRAIAQRLAGSGAEVTVVRDPPWVTVSVNASAIAGIRVAATATAWVEP